MSAVRRLLLATDFSTGTPSQIEFASALAEQLGAELHLLNVVPRNGVVRPAGTETDDPLKDIRLKLERMSLAAAMHRVKATSAVRVGRAADEILGYARENQIGLITMGTRARNHLAQAILGSVAEQVIRSAPCPVLVVPPSSLKGNALRLADGARVLAAQFGPGLTGDRQETRQQMVNVLTQEMDLGAADGSLLMDALEAAGVVTWHEIAGDDGPKSRYWAISTAAVPAVAEAAGTAGSVSPDAEDLGAAIDLLRHAIRNRATDIHIDPASEDQFEIRLRIDGQVEHYCRMDRGIAMPMIQQYKVLAKLDIADPFKFQEGRLHLPDEFQGHQVRLTSAPVFRGQAMALRLFSNDRLLQPLESLGLGEASMEAIRQILRCGSGLVLVTGPTGSGKTTTIYSLLQRLSAHARNIISVEDPIEFPLPFLRQLAVDPRHGITMTSGLRTVLRMDPDIVFLGEIRDAEAAEMAMRAGSAGRFVFSTLHTRDVASTITAIRDLHIDKRSLAANLAGIISQRLVRRLCPDCRRRTPTTEAESQAFLAEGLTPPAELGRPVGCERCRKSGYLDRIGVFEVVASAPPIVDAILAGTAEGEFQKVLRSVGTPSLLGDGLQKVIAGVTSLEEVLGMRSMPVE